MKVPFERSYWVVPGRFLAGCYPGAKQEEQATKKLSDLLESGIRLIINLMEDYETDWKGESIKRYEEQIATLAEARDLPIECLRVPVPETGIPTFAAMKQILDRIDRSIEEGMPVYVHCWGGKGRTGTVVGCYLVRHGRAMGKDALKMVVELRRSDVAWREPSPENERQRWMVYTWPQGG